MALKVADKDKLPRCPIEKEFERKSANEILQRMEVSGHTLEISAWGVRGFASIAGSAFLTQNTQQLAEFLDDGGCEALVNILNKYCDSSEIVASYGCLAIGILAHSMRELREFLGEIGACEAVVFAVSMHVGLPDVSEYGSRALAALANQNISNSYKISTAGGCEALLQVGNFGFCYTHDSACIVATHTALALAYLCEAINAPVLHEHGAAMLVVELMKIHLKDEDFRQAGVKAVCALASLSAHLRDDLGKVGACKILMDILAKPVPNALLLEICEAIMHLTLNPSNTDRFSSLGCCELLLTPAISAPMLDLDFGPEILTGCLLNMSTYGLTAINNRLRLVKAQVGKLLARTRFCVKASFRAREQVSILGDLLGVDLGGVAGPGAGVGGMGGVIHGSEMKGDTVPLQVELREEVVLDVLEEVEEEDRDEDSDAERGYESFSRSPPSESEGEELKDPNFHSSPRPSPKNGPRASPMPAVHKTQSLSPLRPRVDSSSSALGGRKGSAHLYVGADASNPVYEI